MVEVKICPKCGLENYKPYVKCDNCGASLEDVDIVDAATKEKVQKTKATNEVIVVRKSNIATMLKAIAIITYVGAFILGLVVGRDDWGDFYFGLALIYWVAGFVCGSVVLGFAEIVRLLHEINQKK